MPDYLRAYVPDDDAVRAAVSQAQPGTPIRFVASTEDPGRDGLVIEQAGWDLTNFKRNPVFLWAHSYGSSFGGAPLLPLGRASVEVEGARLMAEVTFDQGDDFAREVERKYRAGFLNAVSVGWDTKEMEPGKDGQVGRVKKAELLDVSAVPVPGDPKALAERQKRALAAYGRDLLRLIEPETPDDPVTDQRAQSDRQHRGAIPPHATDKAPIDAAWDGPGEVARADGPADLRRMHAWVDADGDPDLKQSYKLPHHLTENGQVVWRGVAAAMARLLQAGTQIPDADRRGVYAHLQRHYRQFDRTPPEFRTNADLDALGPAEIRGLFLEGEPDLFPDFFAFAEQRAGQVLSTRNRERLEQAQTLLAEVLRSAEKTPKDEPTDEERAVDLLALFDQPIKGAA